MPKFKEIKKLPLNIQLFSDGEGGENPDNTPDDKGGDGGAQVFSAQYVGTIRRESAGYRTRAVSAENSLKKILGLKEDEELGNIESRISDYQKQNETALTEASSKADSKLINAALSSLEGYDSKLIQKLIDRSKITVSEDGKVDYKAALEELEKEYPSVKKVSAPNYAENTGSSSVSSGKYGPEEAKMRRVMGLKVD